MRRSALKTTRRLEIIWRKPPTSGVAILNIASGIITKLYKNAHIIFCLILAVVFFDKSIAINTSFKSLSKRVTSAVSVAISEALLTEKLTSACFRAGASLIPSPTKATTLCFSCNF